MRFATLLIGAAGLLAAAGPITGETIRQEALDKLAAGMFTRYMVGQAADTSRTIGGRHRLPFPDAFAGEKVYHVTGKLGTLLETCAAANEPPSNALSARCAFKLYRWPVASGSASARPCTRFRQVVPQPKSHPPLLPAQGREMNTA